MGMVENRIPVSVPLGDDTLKRLRTGDRVAITGRMIGARDAAHRRMVELLKRGESLPFDPRGAVIYYVGPTPAPPGRAIGSAGPTTSSRMDPYSVQLLEVGVKGMVGKGPRSKELRDALGRFGAVYFVATGGAGALLSTHIKAAQVLAFEDLGPEAVRSLEVEDFPAIVAYDTAGGDLFEEGVRLYRTGE